MALNITITTRKRQKNLVRLVHRNVVERIKSRERADSMFSNVPGGGLGAIIQRALGEVCNCDDCRARRGEDGLGGQGPATGMKH